jgi:hypothetical protein
MPSSWSLESTDATRYVNQTPFTQPTLSCWPLFHTCSTSSHHHAPVTQAVLVTNSVTTNIVRTAHFGTMSRDRHHGIYPCSRWLGSVISFLSVFASLRNRIPVFPFTVTNSLRIWNLYLKGKLKNIPYLLPCVQPWQRHQSHEFLIFLSKDSTINI